MTIADYATLGLLAVNLVVLLIAVRQLRLNRAIAIADHDRRKKQATFEFVNAVSDRYRKALDRLNKKHGRDKLVDYGSFDEADKSDIRGYLSEMERICTGVNSDVFDIDMLNRMMGGTMISNFQRFGQYIVQMRAETGRNSLYEEFEETVHKIAAMRRDYVPSKPPKI